MYDVVIGVFTQKQFGGRVLNETVLFGSENEPNEKWELLACTVIIYRVFIGLTEKKTRKFLTYRHGTCAV